MLFNSIQYLAFFPIVVLLFYLISVEKRWFFLLLASCVFYGAFIPAYLFILFFIIVVDYFSGIMIEKSDEKQAKYYLFASIFVNLSTLFIFKYYNFFIENASIFFQNEDNLPFLNVILPIGLSFHTFQAMSYTIEVYKGNQKAEKHFGIYALYVMFFPQLVAGPIEKPQQLLPQLHALKKVVFDEKNTSDGLRLMLWGLFKKVVIADRLALLVEPVFQNPQDYPSVTVAIAVLFFTIQIYCDFSGYSDMALGSAQIFGIKMSQNFKFPYFASSISDFWTRWHISLSSWFREYVYIPLGGNRVSSVLLFRNILIVFLLSGFWHGANWTFIVWGLLHGIYLIFGILWSKISFLKNLKIPKIINIVFTFCLVSFTWIFFRATSISSAFYIAKKTFLGITNLEEIKLLCLGRLIIAELFSRIDLILYFFLIVFLFFVEYFIQKNKFISLLEKMPRYQRWAFYYAFIFIIFLFGVFQNRQFIYFQF